MLPRPPEGVAWHLGQIGITDNLDLLLGVLPPHLRAALGAPRPRRTARSDRATWAASPRRASPNESVALDDAFVDRDTLRHITERVGTFGKDNRAGIERTLHRISAIRNRQGEIIGLTCRVGRAVIGTVDIVRDVIESGRSILLLGRPGVGKTTLLREAARVLADELRKRVVVVDTSNEIARRRRHPTSGHRRARAACRCPCRRCSTRS